MGYYAGVDGGASKTLAVIVDESGNEVGRGAAAGSNYQALGLEKAVSSVQQALEKAMQVAGLASPETVLETALLGLSGLDRPTDIALWNEALAKLPDKLSLNFEYCNDAELLLAALPGRIGLGLICGTGSISVGRDESGNKARSGGWGHYFGDEGSGLWFGRNVLQAAARMADGRGPETKLLELVLQDWKLERPEQLIGEVYIHPHPDNARIARLSGLVFKAAKGGDKVSETLIEKAAEELGAVILAVYRKLEFKKTPSLAMAGGVILHYHELAQLVVDGLKKDIKLDNIVPVNDPALAAARELAGITG
jgi:N-acetylglucosamine kinase-like BadF-type ATPase